MLVLAASPHIVLDLHAENPELIGDTRVLLRQHTAWQGKKQNQEHVPQPPEPGFLTLQLRIWQGVSP
jgi:hypothetical protein